MSSLAERTDSRILEGARRALERYGARGATLDRIAEEAGLSRVTLHRRQMSREAILASLAESAAVEYRDALWPALTAPGTARERLEQALAAICAVAERNLQLLVALQAESDAVFHEADPSGPDIRTRSPFTDPLERLLRDGAVDGTLREREPVETATVLFNQVGWTYIHLRTGHRWAAERAQREVVDIALHGLAR